MNYFVNFLFLYMLFLSRTACQYKIGISAAILNFIDHLGFLIYTISTNQSGQTLKMNVFVTFILHTRYVNDHTIYHLKYNFLIKTHFHGGHLGIFVHFEFFNSILILT